MVSYRISKARREGGIWVCDVSEFMGNAVLRRVTVKLSDVCKFVDSVFHGAKPVELERLLEE